ncbi:hypothetical protein HH214_20850 [Mucilaginibacter robiniae]|uniref:Periplasmic heavy metal sensor n=1 Tax=Mucilaginibacter robiniae TaxID=2728022 RepID=A0A7L5E4A0_9SPHI|nr:hypothetical protein [Mucilaginibacter robiniae]QJD98150.1 hypothetical protein HH214_20850 [Mucilaginibacter robiniae]
MKKILLMCCFVLGISAVSFAQGGGRQRPTPDAQAKQLQTDLKLTDDQYAKVLSVFQAQSKSMDSLMTASNGDRQTMMQSMRPLRQSYNTKIQAILTDEQKATYQKMMQERIERMRQNGGGGAPPSQE